MSAGIEQSLRLLTDRAWVERLNPRVREWTRSTIHAARTLDRDVAMHALVDELYRATGAGARTLIDGTFMDADDACLAVAAAAMSVGILCRFVSERRGNCWTVRLVYEASPGQWETIDCLRQHTDKEPDERVLGPIPSDEACGPTGPVKE